MRYYITPRSQYKHSFMIRPRRTRKYCSAKLQYNDRSFAIIKTRQSVRFTCSAVFDRGHNMAAPTNQHVLFQFERTMHVIDH